MGLKMRYRDVSMRVIQRVAKQNKETHRENPDGSDDQFLKNPLVEGRDYTLENGKYIFSSYYLTQRGQCCGSGCRNCPYKGSSDS